jgi:N-acetylmuramoyl-L-alanine amidase
MLAPVSNAVAAVPASFAGTGRAQLDLAGPLRAPRGQFRFSLDDMVLAKHALPDVDGALAFDAATRKLLLITWLKRGETTIARQKLPLEGRYIGINPGHQQKANYNKEKESPEAGSALKIKVSAGTQGVSTRVPEYVVTLQVGLKLRDKLESMGARVLMARTAHNVDVSNGDRARAMNVAGVQLYLSLHCDGNDNHRIAGLHTLIPAERGYQKGPVLAKSQSFAHIMQQECIKTTGAVDKGFSVRRDLSSLNWAKMPTCLVEMGFMTNATEDKKLVSAAYQDKIVTGMARAIKRYFAEVK